MKTRNGFISNSSSTSFIVNNPEDIKLLRNRGVDIYHVGIILSRIDRLLNYVPHFIQEDLNFLQMQLQEVFDKNSLSCITSEIDRNSDLGNFCYENGFEIFENDL